MQKDNKLFDDMARMASSAAGGFMEMKRELDGLIAVKVEKFLQKLNLATREELDAVQAMLVKAREEQEELKKRLDALERK